MGTLKCHVSACCAFHTLRVWCEKAFTQILTLFSHCGEQQVTGYFANAHTNIDGEGKPSQVTIKIVLVKMCHPQWRQLICPCSKMF